MDAAEILYTVRVQDDPDNILETPILASMESIDESTILCETIDIMSQLVNVGTTEEAATIYHAHVAVGFGNKDSRKESGADINVSVDLAHEIMSALKRLIEKISQALIDLFRRIFIFFQDKVFNTSNRILIDNIKKIERYYQSKEIVVNAKLHKFAVSNPVEEFIKDSSLLKDSIPKLCEAVERYVQKYAGEVTLGKIISNSTGLDGDMMEIEKIKKTIKKSIFKDGSISEISSDISKQSVAKYLNKKYFGEKREIVEQPVNNVIPSVELFRRIIGTDSYNEFKSFRYKSEKAINSVTKDLARISSYYMVKDTHLLTKIIAARSNLIGNYLKLMLQTIIGYWNLYFVFRKDVMRAAEAIIKSKKNSD